MIENMARNGVSVSQIAKDVGVDRKTVRRTLNEDRAGPTGERERASVLDPYKDYLKARLEVAVQRQLELRGDDNYFWRFLDAGFVLSVCA